METTGSARSRLAIHAAAEFSGQDWRVPLLRAAPGRCRSCADSDEPEEPTWPGR
jgi:hypothetical protein